MYLITFDYLRVDLQEMVEGINNKNVSRYTPVYKNSIQGRGITEDQ